MDETSISLLQRIQQGADPDSWQRLANAYVPMLQAWLRRYDVQPSDADDLVQDVLAVLSQELSRFRHSGRQGAFRSWLRKILVNRLRDFWRKRQYRPTAAGGTDFLRSLEELADPRSGMARLWDREHDRHLLRELLLQVESRFSESTMAAFRRVVLDGADARAVARELGLTLNAVVVAKCRVLKELRREGRGILDD
jgi:RNA polymerase sigma-70 factor (ECF subfamily)